MKTIQYVWNKEIPVIAECDVLVGGGGPGGLGASVMAARSGAKTVLAEQHGRLGGTAAFGEVSPMMPNHYTSDGKWDHGVPMDRPVYLELMKKMNEYFPEEIRTVDFNISFNDQKYIVSKDLISLAMEDLCLDAGVQLLFHFELVDVIREGRRITHAVFHTKSGFAAISAKNFVDASGDGDLAALAGCEFEFGDREHGLCQPMTLCFKLSHVEKTRIDHKQLQELYKKAQASGKIECKRENVLMFSFLENDVIHFNTTRVLGKSAIDALSRSEAEVEARKQMRQIVNWLRSEVAGFEHARYYSFGAEVGIRESRRIIGRQYLTQDDFVRRAKFPDAIVRCNYPIDIHSVTGSGTSFVHMTPNEYYEIPFGCIVARDADNLTIAGRPISVSHELHASSRVMPPACSVGQAAGLSAALASKRGIDVSALDGVEVRNELIREGAWLSSDN